MKAYVIADIEVRDPEEMKEYQKHVPASLEPFGGRFLVRGGAYETLEGDWKPRRVVVIEFPDMKSAKAWYASAEYQKILPLRLRASDARFFTLIEGA